jgi:hypothetical protein
MICRHLVSRHRHRQAYRPEFLLFEVVCDDPLRVFFLAVVPLLSDSPSLLLMLACFAVTVLLTGVGTYSSYCYALHTLTDHLIMTSPSDWKAASGLVSIQAQRRSAPGRARTSSDSDYVRWCHRSPIRYVLYLYLCTVRTVASITERMY